MSPSLRTCLLQAATVVAVTAAPLGAQAEVIISTAATTNITCTGGICTPSKKTAILNATQLENLLASGSVKITTAGSKSSDILVTATISWASAGTMTLDAYRSITINKSLSVNGSGGLTILTNDGGTGGDYSFGPKGNVTFLGTTNPLTINGNSYTLVSNIATLASDIAAQPAGFYALAGNYNASADGTHATSPIPTTLTGTFEGLGNTISKLTIVNTTNPPQYLGLFSQLNGTIRDVGITNAHVEATSTYLGVLAGFVEGIISRSYATGEATGKHSSVGGFAGFNAGLIIFSHGSVAVAEHGRHAAGGLIGTNAGMIVQCYSTGPITGSTGVNAGGLVGLDAGAVTASYATGSVSDSDYGSTVGGLIGDYTEYTSGNVSQTYSTGFLSGGTDEGGLVGIDRSNYGTISYSYWDTDTSGVTSWSQGAGFPRAQPGIAGLTTAQFQSGLPAGFDPSIWAQSPSLNGGLPYLIAVPPA